MFQWCSLLFVEHLPEATSSPWQSQATGQFWASFLSMAYQRCLWVILGHWTLGLSLKDRSKSICHFNFHLNPVCKTCSWNLFEVSKNDLKRCVLEIAALLQSQGEVGSALLGQSTPPRILSACSLWDLRLSLCWIYLHSFLPCFSLLQNFTKVRSPSD